MASAIGSHISMNGCPFFAITVGF
ncbi:hypothetical protein CFP56_022087 [Quercus suber]|uniref:Uncharacterized protein n=1 Tax=Quercus suber TaxID=58331 RepID=A0AAW0M062_QUESU